MKILFSADWHLKLGTKNIPDAWAINRYNILFDRLHELESQVDIHIIGGDLFDRLPNMGELELYFKYISKCKIPTFIYSGNHEALKKDTTFLSHLEEVTNKINPLVHIYDDVRTYNSIDFLPYNKLKEFANNKLNDWPTSNHILCTHVRGEIPPHVKAEVDLSIFDRWKVVLAGDLHSFSNSQRNILYPGSPVTTSFHRGAVDTGVIIIDADTLDYRWERLEVPQLIRKTIQAGEEMTADPYHHIIYEVEGDMDELSGISDHELLDKKVVKRDTDVALILTPEMTMAQEVEEYLTYILQVSEESVEKALQVLNDYTSKIRME